MKKKSEITQEYGYLKIDGKYFELNTKDGVEKTSYVLVSDKKVKEKMKLMKEISDKLKEGLNKEAVLMEALGRLDTEYLELLHNSLYNSKRKVKPRTRQHHCVDMKVGKMVIPLIN